MDVEENPAEIDESLYSRQLYVMGREGQARMAASGRWEGEHVCVGGGARAGPVEGNHGG